MSDLRLKPDHDLDLENQSMSLTEDGDESVAQRLKITLWAFKGEWFLNDEWGTPYHQEIFVKGITKDEVDFIYKDIIKNTPGVIELLEYSSTLDRSARTFTLNFKVRTTSGTSSFSVVA